MKRAFTLIEVNLAILVMAGGILSVVVLYSLGFRESRQSREDIISAAIADDVLGPVVGALSATDLEWSKFNAVNNVPENGWGDFVDRTTGAGKQNTAANSIFGQFGVSDPCGSLPSGYVGGLVVQHEEGSGLIRIGFRVAKRWEAILSAPLYYTEVRFQGKQDSKE